MTDSYYNTDDSSVNCIESSYISYNIIVRM
jgi:hypothetical protein